jgi:hypothetical protein
MTRAKTLTPPPYSNPFVKLINKRLIAVGRTVPSFRIAAEIERTKWKQFRSYLDKKDRKMFDQMYDCVKLHNTAVRLRIILTFIRKPSNTVF